MNTYKAFHRTFYRWTPGGLFHQRGLLIPSLGRKTILGRHLSYDEARQLCENYNSTHKPGKTRRKAEFTRE